MPGFDTRSQQQILSDRIKERQAQTLKLVEGLGANTPADRTAATIGGLLSNALGNKFSPPTLQPDEQRRLDAIGTAQQRSKDWRSAHPDADAEEFGMEAQRHLAEELIKNGDLEGIDLAKSWAEQSRAKRTAAAEYDKLLADTKLAKAHERAVNFDTDTNELKVGKDTMSQIWLPGSYKFGDPGMAAYIDKDLTAHYQDAQGKDHQAPKGQWSIHPPAKGFKDFTIGDLGIPDSEGKQFRDQLGAVMKLSSDAVSLGQVMKDSVTQQGTVDFLDKSGSVADWGQKWMDNLGAMARTIGGDVTVNGKKGDGLNLNSSSGAQEYIRRSPELVNDLAQYMPEKIRGNSVLAERWAAGVTRMAYSLAKSQEPGARNVTDNDFDNQVRVLAASSTNPESFRQIMLANVAANVQSFEDRRGMYEPAVQAKMVSVPGLKRYEQRLDEFHKFYDSSFGTAANPGPGLTGAGESEDDFLNRVSK